MLPQSKVSVTISPEKQTAIREKMTALQEELKDLLTVHLSAEERMGMLSMGSKSVDFVSRALDFATNNPTIVPAYVDVAEAVKDLKLVRDLEPLIQELSTLLRAAEDLSMLAGSEAFDVALIFYHSVKGASRAQVPGTQAIHDDLRRQFPRPSRKK